MYNQKNLQVLQDGHLYIGGCDTVALAREYGTPLYVMDENVLRENCRAFKASIDQYYNGYGRVLYAGKTFLCKAVCRLVNEEGLGLDVASGGELYTAIQAGFPAERIYFHGNNKTKAELELALREGVHRIVVDNLEELDRLDRLAVRHGKKQGILLRIKPGIDAHTHDFVRTGQNDSKFGLSLESGEAMQAIKIALECANIELFGYHVHIGSQIHELDPFALAGEVMLQFTADVRDQTGYAAAELNLGGGFGIRYTDEDQPQNYEDYMRRVSGAVKAKAQALGLPVPFIMIEPGRSIAGPAGLTLYTIGSVKEILGIRNYVAVDGGMTDNPRYALYGSKYEVLVANEAAQPRDYTATIAGKCCESGDLIQEHTPVQEPKAGDILAVLSTGAYNYSMSSNYNRNPRPAVVFVKDGTSRVAVRRESYEDLVRNDL